MGPWAALCFASWAVSSPIKPLDKALDADRLDLSVLPAAGYSADNGFGVGVVLGSYWRKPGFNPYKFAVEALFYFTNRQVHEHGVYFDWLRVNGWPLRIIGGGWFFATLNDTYCGFGNNVTCSTRVAQQAASALG